MENEQKANDAQEINACADCAENEATQPLASENEPTTSATTEETSGAVEKEIASASAVAAHAAPVFLTEEQKKEKRTRLCALIEGIGLMAGVFFSLLFVFFIGVSVGEGVGVKANIFHFFGDAWKEFGEISAEAMDSTTGFANANRVACFFYSLIGLAISVATLFGVIFFAVRATMKYVRVWTKKEENQSQKDALACIFCFLAGSALFVVHNYLAMTVMGFKLATEVNGGTVAGIVLTILAICTKLICNYLSKEKGFFNRNRLIKLAFVGGTALLLAIVIGIAQDTVIALKLSQDSYISIETLLEGSPFLFANYIIGTVAPNYYDTGLPNYEKVKAMAFRLDIYSIVVSLATVAFILLAFYALWKKLKADDGEEKVDKRLSIVLTALSVVMLAFSIASCGVAKKMFDTAGAEYSVSGEYGRPICCLIFSILLLAADILRPRLMKRFIKEEKAEEKVEEKEEVSQA